MGLAVKELKEATKNISSELPDFSRNLEPESIKSFKEANERKNDIKTINKSLEGKKHPVSEVPYEAKEIEVNGEIIEGVFPEFEAAMEVDLEAKDYQASDRTHFEKANQELFEEVKTNPELSSRFDEIQLEQIENKETPDGYVWHHAEEPGRLELVDETKHRQSAHTGGRNIWGGGTSSR